MDFQFINNLILFEDDHIIALNKPAGLLSIEDGYDRKIPNLRSILRTKFGSIWAVHRLDKNTSGVILFCKHAESHKVLNQSFVNHSVTKKYRSIHLGFPFWNFYEINFPLTINHGRKHRTIIDFQRGKKASTIAKKLTSNDLFTYFEVTPKTGFRHQIRAHLSSMGFPLLGDDLYFQFCFIKEKIIKEQIIFQGNYFLHAYSLEFPHPVTKQLFSLTAPLPNNFLNILETENLLY